MIQWHGEREIKISSLVLPGDFPQRLQRPYVGERAESIRRHGLINFPVVQVGTHRLLIGEDRIAALITAGIEEVRVRLVEGTPAELRGLQIAENLHRRHSDDWARLLDEYLSLREEELGGTFPDKDEPRPVGRPKTARGRARDELAAIVGVPAGKIREAERYQRWKANAEEDSDEPSKPEAPPPCETWGIEFEAAELERVAAINDAIEQADRKLRDAQAALTVVATHAELGKAVYSRVRPELHAAADAVRRANIAAVCPYCKRVPRIQRTCSGCSGAGFVGSEVLEAIAPQLRATGSAAMVVDGGRMVMFHAARRQGPGVLKQ